MVAVAISPVRQRNAVSEGVALGLLMCNRSTLPWDKVAVDLAFEGAWRSWPYRNRFPQVDTDIRNGLDGVWAMTRADERKHSLNFYWDARGHEIAIYPRPIWADGELDVDQCAQWIDGDVPADGWREFAVSLLDSLSPGRHEPHE